MEQNDPYQIERLTLKSSISYMVENLAVNNKYAAYVSTTDPLKIIINLIEKEDQLSSDRILKDFPDQITDIQYVEMGDSWQLIVTQMTGFRIYSEDGGKLLWHFQQNLADQKVKEVSELNHYYQGITTIKTSDGVEILCIGSTNSEIYFTTQMRGEKQYVTNVGIIFTEQNTKISCIASSNEDGLFISADIKGNIQIFMCLGVQDIGYIRSLPSKTNNTPITSMTVMERKQNNPALANILVCGDFLGKILLFDLNEFCILATMNSHVRMITSIDCSSEKSEIVSGSQDTYLNIWRVDDKNEVALKLSYRLSDQLIVGVKYVKKGEKSIVVSCFESLELNILQGN